MFYQFSVILFMKQNVINNLTKSELLLLTESHDSIKEIFKHLGLNIKSGSNYRTFKKKCDQEGVCLESLSQRTNFKQTQFAHAKQRTPECEIFCEKSLYLGPLKKRLLSFGHKEDVCSECGIRGVYNNKPITLQVDHINGINDDNRLENLRILCPNCHSQTETYGRKKRSPHQCSCGKRITRESNKCKECAATINGEKRRKAIWPSNQELQDLLWKIPTTKIAEALGVSDVSVARFAKRRGLTKPPRGFWT